MHAVLSPMGKIIISMSFTMWLMQNLAQVHVLSRNTLANNGLRIISNIY